MTNWRKRPTRELPIIERNMPLGLSPKHPGRRRYNVGDLICDAIKAMTRGDYELCSDRCAEYHHMRDQGHRQPPAGDSIIEMLERKVSCLTKTAGTGL